MGSDQWIIHHPSDNETVTRQMTTSDLKLTHRCSFCFKVFNSHCFLELHMRLHTGERPFVCNVCSKAFIQKSDLVRHGRIHTGERPFKCPLCDYSATQSSHLKSHIKGKHP